MSCCSNIPSAAAGNRASSNPSTDVSKKKKYILITNGESYLGRILAMFITDQLTRREGQLKRKHWCVRVLCEDKQNLKDLEKRGIEVEQVDYESQSMLRDKMKDHIKTVIFNPFTKSSRLISHGKNLLDAAAHEKIKRIMMISSFGCSFYHEKETPVGQFNVLEEHLRKNFNYDAWVVFRIPFIQQYFYFWTSMIENKSVIGFPISELNVLETVNVKDICESVSQAALSKKSMVWNQQQQQQQQQQEVNEDNFDNSSSDSSSSGNEADDNVIDEQRNKNPGSLLKRVYEIKCTLPMNPSMIAQALSNALQEEGYDAEVEPAVITEERLEDYLKCVSEQGTATMDQVLNSILPGVVDAARRRQQSSSQGTQSATTAASGGHFSKLTGSIFGSSVGDAGEKTSRTSQDDPNWYPCPSEVLTPFCIQLIIDHFRVARCPEIPMFPSNDVRDITGREPVQLAEFFMNNRRQFRPQFK